MVSSIWDWMVMVNCKFCRLLGKISELMFLSWNTNSSAIQRIDVTEISVFLFGVYMYIGVHYNDGVSVSVCSSVRSITTSEHGHNSWTTFCILMHVWIVKSLTCVTVVQPVVFRALSFLLPFAYQCILPSCLIHYTWASPYLVMSGYNLKKY